MLHFYNSFRMWEGKNKRGGKCSRYFWQKLQFCGCMLALFQSGWYPDGRQGRHWFGLVENSQIENWKILSMKCLRIVFKTLGILVDLGLLWSCFDFSDFSPQNNIPIHPCYRYCSGRQHRGVITITLFCLRVKAQVGLPSTQKLLQHLVRSHVTCGIHVENQE